MTKKKSKRKTPMYAQISEENEMWIAQQVVATGHTMAFVVNRAVECAREGKKFSINKYEPFYVKKLKDAHEKRMSRFKDFVKASMKTSAITPNETHVG